MLYPVSLKVYYTTGELDGDVINSVESTHVLECKEDMPVLCRFLDCIGVETYSESEIKQVVDMLEQRVSNRVMHKELYFSLF